MLKKRTTVEFVALSNGRDPWGDPPMMRTYGFAGPGDAELWSMQLASHALAIMQMLPMDRSGVFSPSGKIAAAPVGMYVRRGHAGATRRYSAGPEYDFLVMRVYHDYDDVLSFGTWHTTFMKMRSSVHEDTYPQSDRISHLGAAIPDDHSCVSTTYGRRRDSWRWEELRKDKTGDLVRLMRTAMANALIRYAFEQLCGPAS